MPLPRQCKRCQKRFQPRTKGNWVCDECRNEANKVNGYRSKKGCDNDAPLRALGLK